MSQDRIDDALGITRCARCGHRLQGEIECPFCSVFEEKSKKTKTGTPKWVFLTACFLTSPLSLYAVVTTTKLNVPEKILAGSGCLLWTGLYHLFF